MGYAVLLYFDGQTEQRLLDLRRALIQAGISSRMNTLGVRPHISLAGFSEVDRDSLLALVQDYANSLEPFRVRLSAIGLFPTPENVLFLSPAPTLQLLTCHQEFQRRLTSAGLTCSPYYAPGSWVPHCTLDMNILAEQFHQAIEYCHKALEPIMGVCQAMGVIEYWPLSYLGMWPFRQEPS